MRKIDLIILHCSASDSPGQDADLIRSWHKKRGFSDIGYHYFIRQDGTLDIGRPIAQIGAHCLGDNHNSIGICLAGLKRFLQPQFDTLRMLLVDLKPLYPTATLHGHCERPSGLEQRKSCPVFSVTPWREFWMG